MIGSEKVLIYYLCVLFFNWMWFGLVSKANYRLKVSSEQFNSRDLCTKLVGSMHTWKASYTIIWRWKSLKLHSKSFWRLNKQGFEWIKIYVWCRIFLKSPHFWKETLKYKCLSLVFNNVRGKYLTCSQES